LQQFHNRLLRRIVAKAFLAQVRAVALNWRTIFGSQD